MMMTKSLFLLFVTSVVFASGFVAPAAQRRTTARPFIVTTNHHPALFLHPEQAKALEEFAYKYMLEASQRSTNDDDTTEKNNRDCVVRKQRLNGPVAWCRRVIQNWKHA
jgi:ABC-type sugar transport system substrate-binding protein